MSLVEARIFVNSLIKIDDLLYYDGPLVSWFKRGKQNFIYSWCDNSDRANRWMVFEITDENINNLNNGKIDLLTAIKENPQKQVLILDLDDCSFPHKAVYLKLEDIPENYLPKTGSFLGQKAS